MDNKNESNLESLPGFEEIADTPLICPKCGKTFGSFRLLGRINPHNEPTFFCLCPRCGESLTYREVRENMVRAILMWGLFRQVTGIGDDPDDLTLKEFLFEVTKIPKHTTKQDTTDWEEVVKYLWGIKGNYPQIGDAPLICPKCGKTFGSLRLFARINPRNEPSFFCLCPHCGKELTYREVRENMVRAIFMWGLFRQVTGIADDPDGLTLKEFLFEIAKLPKHTTKEDEADWEEVVKWVKEFDGDGKEHNKK